MAAEKKKTNIEDAFQIDSISGLAPDYRNVLQTPFSYVQMSESIGTEKDEKRKGFFKKRVEDVSNTKLVPYEERYRDCGNVINCKNRENVRKLNSVMNHLYTLMHNKSSDYRKMKELLKEAEDIIVPNEDHSKKYLNN